LGSRRAHMEAFFKHMGRGSKEQLDKGREVAVLYMCWFLHAKKRLPKIGVVYFELAVYFTIWYNNFKDFREAGEPEPIWPWRSITPSLKDMAGGESQVYAAYL
ncbi:hypothetical protein BGZ61DRAFT_285291, partial [Ilyonectria robusta]|uniref:uncharacterized protein n=1 Tax=Ilyonectria robusta TaxID=1079257 RepID=UPI001E8DBC72